MQVVLNIAAGENVQSHVEFSEIIGEECVLYNIDIYTQLVPSPGTAVLPVDPVLKARALHAIPNVEYGDATRPLDFEDNAADILMAVSPYGFPLLNEETMRVLRRGGHVIVAGSTRNKYVAKNNALCTPTFLPQMLNILREIPQSQATRAVQSICRYISHIYQSRTTHREHGTTIDLVRVFHKRA